MQGHSKFTAIFATLIAVCMLWPISHASATTSGKSEVLKSLRDWRSRIISSDEAYVSEQNRAVKSLVNLTVLEDLETPLNEISKIDAERVEFEARRRIVDQIIFSVDTKWGGADLKGFLENQLLDLAINDLSEPGQGGWWKFLILASVSLKTAAEPGADPIKFLEAYMGESGVLEPKSAITVFKSRKYLN